MKIAILHLNGKYISGEVTFLKHLKSGLEKNNHTVDVYYNDFTTSKLNSDYDAVHINCGKYGEIKYKTLDGLDNSKTTLMIHSIPSIKEYNLTKLQKNFKFKTIFSNSKFINSDIVVKLPFDTSIVKENYNTKYKKNIIVVPTRFSRLKKINSIIKLIANFEIHVFDSRYANNYNNIIVKKQYKYSDLNKIYKNCKYMLDTTYVKGDGERMQYTFLESIYYKTVPIVDEVWSTDYFTKNKNFISIKNITSIKDFSCKDIITSNTSILKKYHNSKKIAEVFINDWK